MAKKFNINDYELIDISEGSAFDFASLSENDIEEMVQDTLEVLQATKGKLRKSPTNLCLASGILGVRGGEFKKIIPIKVSYKKGNTSKSELKVIKKVFSTAKLYYLLRNIISQATDSVVGTDGIYPYLARKKN